MVWVCRWNNQFLPGYKSRSKLKSTYSYFPKKIKQLYLKILSYLLSIQICIMISCKKNITNIKGSPISLSVPSKSICLLPWCHHENSHCFGDPHTCAICIIMRRITAVFVVVALQGRNYISSQSHNKCSSNETPQSCKS